MKIAKEKTIAFTGNRTLTSKSSMSSQQLQAAVYEKLYEILEREHLENGIDTFLSGMAVGFDTLAAIAVTELRRKYEQVRLIAVIPFIGQEAKFTQSQKVTYHELLKPSDEQIVICDAPYDNSAYHKRNDFLIENSCKLIAYHNGKPRSGTGSTIRKATELGKSVQNLYLEL